MLRTAFDLADFLQQQCRTYPEGLGQRDDGLEARIDVAGLETAQHARADAGMLRDVGQGQIQLFADAAGDVTDARRDCGAIDQRTLVERGTTLGFWRRRAGAVAKGAVLHSGFSVPTMQWTCVVVNRIVATNGGSRGGVRDRP